MNDRVTELQEAIACAEREIAWLLLRAESAGSYGNRRFRNLNAMLYRARAARLGERKNAAITELRSLDVGLVEKVELPAAPKPEKLFRFRVVESSTPTGLMTLYWDQPLGCFHAVVARHYEAAEHRAIEEHREMCIEEPLEEGVRDEHEQTVEQLGRVQADPR